MISNSLTDRPVDPEAHEAYLRGRLHMSKLTAEGCEAAIELFGQALEKDPGYAVAYVGIGQAYFFLAVHLEALPDREGIPKAREAATKALELDSNLGDAYATVAGIKFRYDWNWLEAEREFNRAIALNPSSFLTRLRYARYLSAMGRHDEAIAEARRARELDPLSRQGMIEQAQVLYFARQYDRAIEELERTLEIDPDFVRAHYVLSGIYGEKGMWEEKVATDQKTLALSGASAEEVAALGRAYEVSGVRGFWEWWLRRDKEQAAHRYVSDFLFAGYYASLGDMDQAFHSLEKAYAQREDDLVLLKTNPWLDPLRSDPRYDELVRRMNFPE